MKSLSEQHLPGLKIMHLLQGLEIGGLEKMVVSLINGLDRQRYDLSLCCFDGLGALTRLLPKEVKIFLVKRRQGLDYRYPFRLARLLRKEDIQILHLHNSTALFYGTIAAKIAGIPRIIYTEHARDTFPNIKVRIVERILSHFLDRVIVVASYLKDNLIKYQGFSPSKILVIPNGIDERGFENLPPREEIKKGLGLLPGQRVVGIIARLDPIKNHLCLLRAMQMIFKLFPDVMLIIAGDGPMKEELYSMMEDHGLKERVLFLGFRDDVAQLLEAMDIFVLCSKSEGLPITLIEAMASGKAIVASRVGGIPEVIKDGVNGILISPDNPTELAEALVGLINDPTKRVRLGTKAKETFYDRFTLQSMLRSYEEVYTDTLDRPNRL